MAGSVLFVCANSDSLDHRPTDGPAGGITRFESFGSYPWIVF